VAQRFLESLEADAYDELPAPVFTRGFIRAYCQALGESPESALTCYDAREGREPPAPRPAPLPRAGAAEPRARGAVVVSLVLLLVLGMALFTVALVLQPREPGQRSTPEENRVPASRPADVSRATTVPPPPTAIAPPPPATAVAPAPGPPPTVAARQPPVPPPPAPAPVPAVASPAPLASSVPARIPGLDALAGSVAPYRLIARVSDPTWIRVRT
jgi:cytoskeletal protein RodZ